MSALMLQIKASCWTHEVITSKEQDAGNEHNRSFFNTILWLRWLWLAPGWNLDIPATHLVSLLSRSNSGSRRIRTLRSSSGSSVSSSMTSRRPILKWYEFLCMSHTVWMLVTTDVHTSGRLRFETISCQYEDKKMLQSFIFVVSCFVDVRIIYCVDSMCMKIWSVQWCKWCQLTLEMKSVNIKVI